MILESKRLRVEVLSMPRARLAQVWFSSLVPKNAIRFKAIQVKNREAAAEAARSRSGSSQPELPPEVVAQMRHAAGTQLGDPGIQIGDAERDAVH